MIDFPHILLARGDDDGGWVGILFFLVPFILWAIGSIAQKMNQKQAEERRRRLREMMEQAPRADQGRPPSRPEPPPPLPPMRPTHVGPMPVPPAKSRPRPVPPPRVQPPPLPIPKAPKRKPARTPARPPVSRDEVILLPDTPVPASQRATTFPGEEVITDQRRQGTSAQAAAIKQWLRPQTLRQQFILTELFQPPLALRPPREDGM